MQLTLRGLVQLHCRASRREVVRRDDRERPILSAQERHRRIAELRYRPQRALPWLATGLAMRRHQRCSASEPRGPHWRRAAATIEARSRIPVRSRAAAEVDFEKLVGVELFDLPTPPHIFIAMRDLPVRALGGRGRLTCKRASIANASISASPRPTPPIFCRRSVLPLDAVLPLQIVGHALFRLASLISYSIIRYVRL